VDRFHNFGKKELVLFFPYYQTTSVPIICFKSVSSVKCFGRLGESRRFERKFKFFTTPFPGDRLGNRLFSESGMFFDGAKSLTFEQYPLDRLSLTRRRVKSEGSLGDEDVPNRLEVGRLFSLIFFLPENLGGQG